MPANQPRFHFSSCSGHTKVNAKAPAGFYIWIWYLFGVFYFKFGTGKIEVICCLILCYEIVWVEYPLLMLNLLSATLISDKVGNVMSFLKFSFLVLSDTFELTCFTKVDKLFCTLYITKLKWQKMSCHCAVCTFFC